MNKEQKIRRVVLGPRDVYELRKTGGTDVLRKVKPQPPSGAKLIGRPIDPLPSRNELETAAWQAADGSPIIYAHCPFGHPGSVFWVAERWARLGPKIVLQNGYYDLVPPGGSPWWCASSMPREFSRFTVETVVTDVSYWRGAWMWSATLRLIERE